MFSLFQWDLTVFFLCLVFNSFPKTYSNKLGVSLPHFQAYMLILNCFQPKSTNIEIYKGYQDMFQQTYITNINSSMCACFENMVCG